MSVEGRIRPIMSGERRGPGAVALRALLAVAALFYGLAVLIRALLFRSGILRVTRVGAPVVSVGNVVAGGTGKTPFVEHLARRLLARRRSPAILSRGFGAGNARNARTGHGKGLPDEAGAMTGPTAINDPAAFNDEALVLAANLPGVRQVIDADRVRGAGAAIAAGADALVLDDGFQHRRIGRDLDVALVDALEPWGYRRLLPRGLLREPLAALARADAFVITRADLCPPERLEAIRAELTAIKASAPVIEAVDEPTGLGTVGEATGADSADALRGRKVMAFAGIGNPAGFFRRLEALGAEVVARRAFPDHHDYVEADVRGVLEEARSAGADLVVTTQKDAVKLARIEAARGIRVLTIRLRIRSGEADLEALLDRHFGPEEARP